MTKDEETLEKRDYVVVLQAPSAVGFEQGKRVRFLGMPSNSGPVDIVFRMRYVDEGFETPVPRSLLIDVRGCACSLKEAIVSFANAALFFVPFLEVSANAAIGEPDLELAYDNTPGVKEHPFFQCYIPEERGIPCERHRLNVESTIAFVKSVDALPESEFERLHRAMSQYGLALSYWKFGLETIALSHLYMGMEVLTKTAIRNICRLNDFTSELELAKHIGVDIKELGSTIRCSILFQDDKECYKNAKAASDGFEHGFKPFDEVRSLARSVRDNTATYLRYAILRLAGLDGSNLNTLLSAPFNAPIGHLSYVKYIWGSLIGQSENLAEEDHDYPKMKWESSIKSYSLLESGDYHVQINEQLYPSIGKNIQFRPDSIEAWRPYSQPDKNENNQQ